MKSSLVKFLLLISIGSMIALAVLGVYVVAIQSSVPGIVQPAQDNFVNLPSQSPKQAKPVRRAIIPPSVPQRPKHSMPPDAPMPQ